MLRYLILALFGTALISGGLLGGYSDASTDDADVCSPVSSRLSPPLVFHLSLYLSLLPSPPIALSLDHPFPLSLSEP